MINVLITEDDPMVAAINRKFLEKRADVKVVKCFSRGADVLAYLEHNTADLLLMDVYMPGMSGLDTLTEIRHRNINIEVVMITAANDLDSIKHALSHGVLDYLVKPFEEERLYEAIGRYITRRNLLKQSEKVNNPMEQKDIDILLESQKKKNAQLEPISKETYLEKGLQHKTLEKVVEYMKEHPEPMTGQELGDAIGLSRITVRKYLSYLEGHQLIDTNVDYDTGGRPKVLYYWKK